MEKLRSTGISNMGDARDRHNKTARFSFPRSEWTLAYVRAKFGNGTGSATLTLKVDNGDTTSFDESNTQGLYDWTVAQWENMGVDATDDNVKSVLYNPIAKDDFHLYTFLPNEELIFEWENPNDGVMRWALEIGVMPVEQTNS